MKRTKEGFTLMEMLIVVAIIAILAAIAIVALSKALENSREGADKDALRTAMTELHAVALLDADDVSGVESASDANGDYVHKKIIPQQKTAKWQSNDGASEIQVGGIDVSACTDGGELPSSWDVRFYGDLEGYLIVERE